MSTTTQYTRSLLSALIITGAALATASTSYAKSTKSVDLYRVPDAQKATLERIPKNLARWHMGASLILIKNDQFQRIQVPDVGYFDESIFLSDNSALTYSIAQGQHDYIIDLGQFMTVSRFFLNNKSAAGSFQLMSSETLEPLKSGKWLPLTQQVSFGSDVIPSTEFPEVETRYILVRFNIQNEGLIGNFGAMGPLNITQAKFNIGKAEDTQEVIRKTSPEIEFDHASSYTGSRVAFVSGGSMDNIFNLIDEDPTTTYSFPSHEECVVILDLRKKTQMRTLTAQYATEVPGLVQVYMVDHLPTHFSSPEATGVATVTDQHGHVERAELASTGNSLEYVMAKSYEVVRVPESYFMEIEDSYTARASADHDRALQIFDDLERRYVIFRFTPDSANADQSIESAKFVPSANEFAIKRAQAPSPLTFSGVQVIGDVKLDDIVYTLDSEIGTPGTPPQNPPENPPVISQ